jgi:Rieske Fe-S protein
MKLASANQRGSMWRVAPGAVPDDLKDAAAEGILAYSAVCTHLGCMLSDWKADLKVFRLPMSRCVLRSMQAGKSTDGATSSDAPLSSDQGTSASREAKLGFP